MKLTGQRNQCPTCAEYFNTNRGFDAHRYGSFQLPRKCKTPAQMIEAGWSKGKDGFWRQKAGMHEFKERA